MMDTARAIQAAVVRADMAVVTVWAYIRAAPLALAALAAMWWGISRWKARRYR